MERFEVRFWGVRGSTPTAAPEYARYGGNTPCLEVRCDGRLIILDGGTGLDRLGRTLAAPLDADVLLTHTHIDHISGIPFFRPFYDARNRFRVRAGHLAPTSTLTEVMHTFMAPPLFPVPPSVFAANMTWDDFLAGETLDLGDGLVAATHPLNHPNRATAYRLAFAGRTLVYATDHEHVPGASDPALVDFLRGTDVLVWDSTYTDAELAGRQGWGHSTWEEGVRLADAAGVKTLVIFHHDPGHDDDFLDRVQARAEAARPGTLVAREGLHLRW